MNRIDLVPSGWWLQLQLRNVLLAVFWFSIACAWFRISWTHPADDPTYQAAPLFFVGVAVGALLGNPLRGALLAAIVLWLTCFPLTGRRPQENPWFVWTAAILLALLVVNLVWRHAAGRQPHDAGSSAQSSASNDIP